MACAESNLLGLRKELVWITVQLELTNVSNWNQVFRPDLGGIEDVEVKVILIGLRNDLNTELPFGVCAALDSLPEILAMEIGIWIWVSSVI